MKLKRLISVIALLLTLQHASAQQLQASLSHFSTDNGLSSNAIAGIYQDDYGFLWIATWNGLSRFDGYNFYNYRTGNGSRIKNLHNRIYDIAIDQSQNIWMRMYDGRVFVLNRSTDQIINPFEGNNGYEDFKTSSPILVTSAGEVLVTIKDVGLYIMRLDRKGLQSELATTGGLTISSMAEGYQSDIWLGTNEGIHRLDRTNMSLEKKAIIGDEHVSCLHSNGFNIYAATSTGAIYSFAYGQEPVCVRRPTGSGIINLFVDSHGLIWLCDGQMGATRIDPKTGNEKFFQQTVLVPEHDGSGGSFTENNGTVWVRMNHGGYGYYNREKDDVEYFHNDPSNPWNLSNTVSASLELPEGVVWMSTSRRGLEKLEILKNNIVRIRPVPDAISTIENEIRAMYYDKQRQLTLIGNKHSTLYIHKNDSSVITITSDDQGKSLGRLYGISKDSKGNYWICSKDNGLYKMTERPGGGWTLHNYAHNANDQWSLSSNSAYQAIEDKQGNIWVATYGNGVNLMTKDKNGRDIFLHSNNEMHKYPKDAYQKVRTLALDKDGNVWAGTTDGIIILSYKGKKLNIRKMENPDDFNYYLMSTDIVCLNRDQDGQMWVGTNGGGLSHTIGQDSKGNWMFETFDARSGLPSEEIRSITFDQRGNVWFGTDHIICSYDVKKGFFTTFSSLDGVDETMLSEGAAITLETGEILFGTLNGYYVVDRKKLMASTGSLLKLCITDFFLNDELQSPRLNSNYRDYPPECKSIQIPNSRTEFAFRFAALNYQLQHRVHYQYMLEGYDKEWRNADKDRLASYSGVPGGTYLLKIKAFLLESPEKYDMRTVEVIVPGSMFLSTTAIAIYVFLLLLAVLLFFGIRKRLHNQREKRVLTEVAKGEHTDEYEVIDMTNMDEED